MAFKMRFQGLLRFTIKCSRIGDISLIYLEQKVPLFHLTFLGIYSYEPRN